MQLPQTRLELLAGHMEQDGVGEDAVETLLRQVECKQVLLPDFAAAMCARHRGQDRRTFHAHRDVPNPVKATRSRPGPQPRSRIANGARASMCCSSAATFWLTS